MSLKISLKLIDAVQIYKACEDLVPSDVRLPGKVTYVLSRNLQLLRKTVRKRDEAMIALQDAHNSEPLSPTDFKDAVAEINNEEAEVTLKPVQWSLLENIDGMDPKALAILMEYDIVQESSE